MATAKMSGIYEIVNLVNGKRYVGSACKISKRWAEHRSDLARGCHHSCALQRAWAKYGGENFAFAVVETCDREHLIAREQAAFDRMRPEYNTCKTAGSMLGVSPSLETRHKLSSALKGRQFTDEERAKISAGLAAKRAEGWAPSRDAIERGAAKRRGRKASPETCAKLSAAHKGRPSFMLGKRHSDEARARMSETQRANPSFKGRTHTQETRAKISKSRVGRKFGPMTLTEEQRQRLSEKATRQFTGNTFWVGRKHSDESRRLISESKKNLSDETRKRMSEAQRRKPPTKPETRAKMSAGRQGHDNPAAVKDVFSLQSVDGVAVSGTPIELRKITGISPAGMSQLIRGKQAQAKGWQVIVRPE